MDNVKAVQIYYVPRRKKER